MPPASASPPPPAAPLGYKVAVLVFLQDGAGRHLLLLRAQAPNLGCWTPIGGKLETATGESPFECAVRETAEETGHVITGADLHLFAMIAEKAYEGACHWLLFLFHCRKPIATTPPPMKEGRFAFFDRAEIDTLPLPATDRTALWPIFDRHHQGFVALRADCHPDRPLELVVEQVTGVSGAETPGF